MSDTGIKARLLQDMKLAMKAQQKARLGTIRLILAAIKQIEIDERITLTEPALIALLTKLNKQRKDAIAQFQAAGREDLAEKEQAEMAIISEYLPQQLSQEDLHELVQACISQTGASGPADMGKVMALVKEKAQGQADMGQASQLVKALLTQ